MSGGDLERRNQQNYEEDESREWGKNGQNCMEFSEDLKIVYMCEEKYSFCFCGEEGPPLPSHLLSVL